MPAKKFSLYPHAAPWDFLPNKAKKILSARGLGKKDFICSLLPQATEPAYAVFELKNATVDRTPLETLGNCGLRPLVSRGRLRLIFDLSSSQP
jgi:hypothetical protein